MCWLVPSTPDIVVLECFASENYREDNNRALLMAIGSSTKNG